MDEKAPSPSAWDALPSLALVNIFCRTSITDRSRNIPFVCTSWAHATRHPLCWASMIAEDNNTISDDAFVKDLSSSFVDPFDGRRSPDGLSRLQRLIERAAGGAVLTCVYFFPFLSSVGSPTNDDALLRLISQLCPNLKRLSFQGSYNASHEAILEIFHRCTKLELVDFSDSPYFNPLILGELSNCCPGISIRGIRSNGDLEPLFSYSLITAFPSLRVLNISNSTVVDKDLLNIVNGCKDLCYLDITACHRLIYYMHIIKVASARIPHIVYD